MKQRARAGETFRTLALAAMLAGSFPGRQITLPPALGYTTADLRSNGSFRSGPTNPADLTDKRRPNVL
jgi:hypothetical protein